MRAELDRILISPQFRGTKRSQEFLRFIVEQKLSGRAGMLKERWIGAEIFGRSPDYDTGEDSIVRVKANEVRKRLAQYHAQAGPAPELEIELPPGSYVPEFRWLALPVQPAPVAEPERELEPLESTVKASGRTWLMPALAAAAIAAAALGWYGLSRHTAPIDQFWGPVLASSRPVLLCAAQPSVHRITGASRQAMLRGESPSSVPMAEIVVDTDHYVGIGDTIAMTRLSSFFSQRGKASQVRIANDLSPADLGNSPAVLVGAFPDLWTIPQKGGPRFVFERANDTVTISDRTVPGRRWAWQDVPPYTDYAVVSRIFDPRTGQPVITAAGISHAGTQIASDFLTTPEYLQAALGAAKAGWEKQNLQILLRADVTGRTPGAPQVLETHIWPR